MQCVTDRQCLDTSAGKDVGVCGSQLKPVSSRPRVFISWSGEPSRRVAELLKRWLECLLQAADPWVSTEDVAKGAIFLREITDQLRLSSVGILCITRENMEAPWMLFEAGALASGCPEALVCPLLIDLKPGDLEGPLAGFNATTPTKEDLFKLVIAINGLLGARALSDDILELLFGRLWPWFQRQFRKAVDQNRPRLSFGGV